MADPKFREFFTYGDHCASVTLHAPIQYTEDSQNPAGTLLRAITRTITKHSAGLAECLSYALELDGDAYTIHIVGTPIELSKLERTDSGYTFHISIFPEPALRNDETGR